MSIASEISALQADRTSIQNAINAKGGSASSSDGFDDFATLIADIPQGQTPTGTKQISVTQNGTQTENVSGYANAQLNVNIPNSYSAGDEGKVVNNGALVAQTSDTVTENDTYDTTLINSLTVNVSGGGGNRTYLIKDGKIQSGYTFNLGANALLTEETSGDIDYVLLYGRGNNQYEPAYTPLITIPSGAVALVMELVEINSHYGRTWYNLEHSGISMATSVATDSTLYTQIRKVLNSASGYITDAVHVIGVVPSAQGSVKIVITGQSDYIAFLNIKNLYFTDAV